MKEKVFLTDVESFGNVKRTVSGKDRVAYFHEDKGKKCAEINYEIADLEKEAGKEIQKARVKTLDLSGIRPTFLKASSKITTYGVF